MEALFQAPFAASLFPKRREHLGGEHRARLYTSLFTLQAECGHVCDVSPACSLPLGTFRRRTSCTSVHFLVYVAGRTWCHIICEFVAALVYGSGSWTVESGTPYRTGVTQPWPIWPPPGLDVLSYDITLDVRYRGSRKIPQSQGCLRPQAGVSDCVVWAFYQTASGALFFLLAILQRKSRKLH